MPDARAGTLSLTWGRVGEEGDTQALQLGVLAPGQAMYRLDWTQHPTPVDEGLPSALIDALSEAFCRIAGVVFLTETLPDGQEARRAWPVADWLRRLTGQDAAQDWQRHEDVWIRPIAGLNEPLLACTDVPAQARSLFSIGAWHLSASQVVFFCPRDAMPPELPASLVRRCALTKDWGTLAPELSTLGLMGVVTQGHDGDYLGVLPLTPGFERAFARALADQAHVRGWAWRDEGFSAD